MDKRHILEQFKIEETVSVEPCGNGHINHTFLAKTRAGASYILQEINTAVFDDPDALMENIARVTEYLRREIARRGGDPERETLRIIETVDGSLYYRDEKQHAWRMYPYLDDTMTLEQVEKPEDFAQSGLAVGRFLSLLADYPIATLHETIPQFHDLAKRYGDFEKAAEADVCHRAQEVAGEIDFVRDRKDEILEVSDLLRAGTLPLRVTHNDTKLNNVLFDSDTGKALCLIDLDTVMPGYSIFDFGDAIRFGANTAAEDEPDVKKVSLSLELYEAYAEGFLAACGERLTAKEIEMLPMGAKMMTMECGMRFLTDYLQGDVYYQTSRPAQNKDRCRTQLALVADMERKWEQLRLAR
jgi:Ser/Thr protein kinase RdoA (MazF antagonist)